MTSLCARSAVSSEGSNQQVHLASFQECRLDTSVGKRIGGEDPAGHNLSPLPQSWMDVLSMVTLDSFRQGHSNCRETRNRLIACPGKAILVGEQLQKRKF